MGLLSLFAKGAAETAKMKSGIQEGVKFTTSLGQNGSSSTTTKSTSTATTSTATKKTTTKEISPAVQKLWSYTPIQRGLQFSTEIRTLQTSDPLKKKQLASLSTAAQKVYLTKAAERGRTVAAAAAAKDIVQPLQSIARYQQSSTTQQYLLDAESLASSLASTLNAERAEAASSTDWTKIAIYAGAALGGLYLLGKVLGGKK